MMLGKSSGNDPHPSIYTITPLVIIHQQRNAVERARIGIYSANGRAHDISVNTPNPHISAGLERVLTSNTQTDERVGGS
jgi:hypothetical protein